MWIKANALALIQVLISLLGYITYVITDNFNRRWRFKNIFISHLFLGNISFWDFLLQLILITGAIFVETLSIRHIIWPRCGILSNYYFNIILVNRVWLSIFIFLFLCYFQSGPTIMIVMAYDTNICNLLRLLYNLIK